MFMYKSIRGGYVIMCTTMEEQLTNFTRTGFKYVHVYVDES